jgi:hypothetical protein
MYIRFEEGNLTDRDRFEDLGICGIIIFKWGGGDRFI